MKGKFPEEFSRYELRLSMQDKGALWEDAHFIFDANILLGLYRYTEKTRTKMLKIMSDLGDRCWLPVGVWITVVMYTTAQSVVASPLTAARAASVASTVVGAPDSAAVLPHSRRDWSSLLPSRVSARSQGSRVACRSYKRYPADTSPGAADHCVAPVPASGASACQDGRERWRSTVRCMPCESAVPAATAALVPPRCPAPIVASLPPPGVLHAA